MLPKGPYDPNSNEPTILKYWLENKFFKPEFHPQKGLLSMEEMKKDGRESFCIINPPPNAYMRPHIGNVSGYAYQDVFLRYNRLLGKKVLGQPGKDHAGIQGEVVVEKIFIENKGKTKHDMGREKFYLSAYDHFQKLMPKVMADEQRIGLSSDYDRNIFTLDPKIVDTVLGTFIKMFQDKMVYKGVRIVNWDPVAKTTLADIDTERMERETELVYIRYPLINQKVWYLSCYIEETLKRISANEKSVETRALNPDEPKRYFGDIKEGDLIVFVEKSGEKTHHVYKIVKGVMIYKDLDTALKEILWEKVVEGGIKDMDGLRAFYDKLSPNYADKVSSNGLISITLRELDENEYVTVATTRAETMLGDTAVVVNPTDERYKNLVGKKLVLPIINREIPIITSVRVEKEFGTGAVKLTPAHSYDDYVMMNEWNEANSNSQVGYVNIIDKDAKMTGPIPESLKGLKIEESRKEIEQTLENLVVKREKHNQSIMIGERSRAVIEQIMSSQWFIDVEKLKQPAISAVNDGKVTIYPKYMTKKYLQWLENLRDWPVSRSLWWGYRFPVWYKGMVEETIDENGQITQSIGSQKIDDIFDAVNKGLAKVQIDNPGIRLSVIRHAQTDENLTKIVIGRKDVPLNENGRKEAELSAQNLLKTKQQYDLIITSPMIRTKETASIIGEKLGIPIIENALLIERHFGELDGLTWEEFSQKFPELAAINTPTYQENLPSGEKISEVESRVREFISILKKEYADKRVLVVTHAGLIRIFKRELSNKSVEDSRKEDIPNAEVLDLIIKDEGWIQDEDVFDTWFSSGQWPYATLRANDLMDTFFPSDIMETGYDILELWVSRMIMLSMYHEGNIPFKYVYLHGLVKAPDGQKMSKSKNNVIIPDEIINKYGADSLRLLYVVGNTAGSSYPVSYEKLEGNKRFLNKIWNASKFVLNYINESDLEIKDQYISEKDKEMIKKVNELSIKTARQIDKFRIGLAAEELYQEFWHDFCDVYIEEVKPKLYKKDKDGNDMNTSPDAQKEMKSAKLTMYYVLRKYLIMLHPFIPFITETVWQEMPKTQEESKTIMYTNW